VKTGRERLDALWKTVKIIPEQAAELGGTREISGYQKGRRGRRMEERLGEERDSWRSTGLVKGKGRRNFTGGGKGWTAQRVGGEVTR